MTDRRQSRPRPWIVLLLLFGMMALAIAPIAGFAEGQKARPGGVIPGRYIVTYRDGVGASAKTDALTKHRVIGRSGVRHVYSTVARAVNVSGRKEQP